MSGAMPSVDSNAIEVHIARLRDKLEADGEERLIQTVRGAGYALREERAMSAAGCRCGCG